MNRNTKESKTQRKRRTADGTPEDNDSPGNDRQHRDHDDHEEHHRQMVRDFRRRFWISLILTIPILMLAPMIQRFLGLEDAMTFAGDSYFLFAFSVIVFVYGGYPFLKGLFDELRQGRPGMMTLIGLAITVAFVYSTAVVFGLPGKTFFWELATLVVVMLLGHWIEMRSVLGASKALEELSKLLPAEAHRLDDNDNVEDIPVANLQNGDRVLIKPGERIPVDGEVIKGKSSTNEAMVTGESKPIDKSEGDSVIGGSVNNAGSLTVEVTKSGNDSYLSQVIDMVKKAQAGKSRSERTADRAALWLTIIAVGGGLLTLVLWLSFSDKEFVFALERMVTVMVITCPHALGLAIPLVVAVSTSLAAKSGLLIRQRTPFEQARTLDAIVFDKTGTLTKGEFEVGKVISLSDNHNQDSILKLAAGVELESEHTIGRAIVDAAGETPSADNFEALSGRGVQATVDGKDIMVVSPGYLDENNIDWDASKTDELRSSGDTIVYVLENNSPIGAIGLRDVLRDESKEAIKLLHERDIETMIITGDTEEVAKRVAGELGVDSYFAGVLPDKKAEKIKSVQSENRRVAMVGDGINDAPALVQADLGIAIGTGTDVAIESADVVLVNSDPRDVVRILDHAHVTHKKTIQNLTWATGYNAFAIPLAAGILFGYGILLNPAVGALLMSMSTVIVAINARIMTAPKEPSSTSA